LRFVRRRLVSGVGDADPRAPFGEPNRHRPPDPARCAGHQRHLVLEVLAHGARHNRTERRCGKVRPLVVARRQMRIGVIGLVAIGGVTAQRLLDAGFEVSLGAGRLVEEIAAKFPRARVGKSLPDGEYGLILLCVRTADTERALAPAAPLLKPDGAVVCLQNGLPEERAARIVGAQRVLGAVIGWSATMTEPGEYVITGGGKFILGGEAARVEHARLVLAPPFPARVKLHPRGAGWREPGGDSG